MSSSFDLSAAALGLLKSFVPAITAASPFSATGAPPVASFAQPASNIAAAVNMIHRKFHISNRRVNSPKPYMVLDECRFRTLINWDRPLFEIRYDLIPEPARYCNGRTQRGLSAFAGALPHNDK
jgi:hypothetical protein